MDDIRHTYAASWNYSSPGVNADRLGHSRRLDLDLDRKHRMRARNQLPSQNAWLPLLPLPIDIPAKTPSASTSTCRPKRMSVDSHGDTLECRRVRSRDNRALCHFLDRHLPEFDPGLPLSVLLNSAQCHAWVVQATRGGWEVPSRSSVSILEELRYDTPPSTPPDESHLAKRLRMEGQAEEPMDHRLPILGCIITRVLNKVPSDYETSNRPATSVHFMALAVDPEHRRMGIAETLVEQAVRKAGDVANRFAGGCQGTDVRRRQTCVSSTISSLSQPSTSTSSLVTKSALSATIDSPDYFSNAHYDHENLETVSISLRAEGIFRRLKTTGEKDESSMLFWESMGLTARPTRVGGRKGWEGSGVREVGSGI